MTLNPHNIREAAERIQPKVQEIRRHLHQHPELSFKEHETAAYLLNLLNEAGIPTKTGYAGTGMVARIEGQNPNSKHIALRADMDALPIQEANTTSYVSTNPGVMHACGHDVHSACGLGALLVLNELKSEWSGTVTMLFQPGEELLPGGASLMIKDGALSEDLKGIFGQHVFPDLPAGKVGFRPGMYMASTDELYFTVKGQGGHAALPHKLKDPVLAAANLIVALQQVASRKAPAAIPTVLSIGKMEALGATNVVPNEVKLEGTFRTMNEKWRAEAHEHIRAIAKETCAATGVEVAVEIRKGYPFLVNDESLTAKAKAAAIALLGEENVVDLDIRMTGEDFAYYSQHMPSCFYRLGTSGPNGTFKSPVHSSTFDIDESALTTGVSLMAWLAIDALNA
ncbi:MAG: M20 family metallopeptidase [Flavobacteriales bacterium]|nr:M20 family metallopeptidase [Flavobacteriales bacterium]MDG1781245.1 M20 family metallopeptidase [Flavobacteriales bacterium]MDG2245388.1 M20 family metallopeptidase [Flavobacteriales bacterium]